MDNDNKREEKVKQIQYEEDAETNLKRKNILENIYSDKKTQRERHNRHKQGPNQFTKRVLVDADADKEINVSDNLNIKPITDAVNNETKNNEESKKNDETINIEESTKNGETRNVEESKEKKNGENNESVKSTESENVKEESKVKHFLNTCYKIMFFCFHKIFCLFF